MKATALTGKEVLITAWDDDTIDIEYGSERGLLIRLTVVKGAEVAEFLSNQFGKSEEE